MPITPEGFVPYTATEELAQFNQVFRTTMGSSVNPNPAGSTGIFIQELTNIGLDRESNMSEIYAQQFDPRYAQGEFMDVIAALNGIIRKAATPSTATCQLTGITGTVIPIGSQVLNTNGDLFLSTEAGIIAGDGTATIEFASSVAAPIPVDANSLTRIVQQINGWSTVNNAEGGVVGTYQQDDFSMHSTYNYVLGIESAGGVISLVAALNDNPHIKNVYVAQNTTGSPLSIYGVIISPNSVYVSLDKGSATDEELGNILAFKTPPGCGMDGDTTIDYTDPVNTWQVYPVTYQAATPTGVQFDLIVNGAASDYPDDIKDQIAYSIYNNFYGYQLQPRIRILEVINTSRFYLSLAAVGVFNIYSFTVQRLVDGTPSSFVQLNLDELPMVATEDVGPIPPGLDAADIYVNTTFNM